MNRLRLTIAVLLCLAGPLMGCVRTSDGVPVSGGSTATPPSTTTQPTEPAERSAPGVVPTIRTPIPAGAVTCSHPITPAATMTAEVADPQAPKITVAVPDGWSPSIGSGEVGARADGPHGMFATVTIAATQLDPAAAFTEYADRIMEQSAVSSVSILPAQLCGYSGQKLLGAWSDNPQNAVEFADRIVHVWTDTGTYLVAAHVQAPTGTPGFDVANALLTEDFEVRIP
jgi:hypothetical protein